jgi:STIP1 family protein 1
MEDPVIAESGHTYERSAIETHMKQNGKFDPFTRKEISEKLYSNLLVKTLIDDFLQ